MSLLTLEQANNNKMIQLPSGIIVSETVAEEYVKQRQRPIAIDLFAGAGGMSCGLTEAGFDVLAASDNDPHATMTYMHNLGAYPCQFYFVTDEDEKRFEKALQKQYKGDGEFCDRAFVSGGGWISNYKSRGWRGCEHFFFGDARQLKGQHFLSALGMKRGDVDAVVGGPPCQGFSRAGKQDVMDPRNSLIFDFARIVCEIQPKTMVLENVPGIVNMVTPEGVRVVDAVCSILADGGMGTYEALKQTLNGDKNARAVIRTNKTDHPKSKKTAAQAARTAGDTEQLKMFT